MKGLWLLVLVPPVASVVYLLWCIRHAPEEPKGERWG